MRRICACCTVTSISAATSLIRPRRIGPYTNEELLGRFLKELPRESVVVATKFGFRLENGGRTGIDSVDLQDVVPSATAAALGLAERSRALYKI